VPLVVSPSVAELDAAARAVVADDGFIATPGRLLGNIETSLESITRTYAAIVRDVRAATAMQATGQVAGKLPRAWLVEDLCLSRRTANQIVLLATYLVQCPLTETAFAAAEIGLEHAVRIVRGLLTLPVGLRPTVEPHLVEWARFNPPEDITGFITELLARLGAESAAEQRRQKALGERGLTLTPTFGGNRAISGAMTPEAAAIVEEALRVFGCTGDDPDTHAAAATDAHADPHAAREDDRTVAQRNHDSLVGICRAFIAAAHAEPDFTGTPVGVIVTIPLDVLEGRLTDQSATLLPSAAQIGPDTARRLACDAKLIPTVLGSRSEVLDQGRATREFTPAIRRAAYLEQAGRCAFPRCQRRISDCHHIIWWLHNGRTTLDNAAWLCSYHHWLAHEGGWKLTRDATRNFIWTSPTGHDRTRHLSAA
jgi:hypothetical protein